MLSAERTTLSRVSRKDKHEFDSEHRVGQWRSPEVPPESSSDVAEYIPSPAEIREACARIQAEWSEAERRKRESQQDSSGFRGAVRVCRLVLGDQPCCDFDE